MKPSDVASRFVGAVFLVAILLLGLKGCTIDVWESPSVAETYSIHGVDGRSLSITFLPDHQTLLWYADSTEQHFEGALVRMRGSRGRHYFWRVWHIEGPGVWFGWRIFPHGTVPVHMEIEVLSRYMEGRGRPTFPEVGERGHQVLFFSDHAVDYQGMRLQQERTDAVMVDALLAKLGGPQPLR